MREIINRLKRIVRCFIPDTIWLLKYYGKLKVSLEKSCIEKVRPYKFLQWHSGFNYFTGYYSEEKVFIKFCAGEYNTIPAELQLKKHSDYNKHPLIVSGGDQPFPWIATAFRRIGGLKNSGLDAQKAIDELVAILDELYMSGIMHRDLRPENICVDENGKVILIDFGWAIYREQDYARTNYSFIEKILNQDYRDADRKFDDAVSVYLSIKEIYPAATNEMLQPISDRIGRLSL